MGGCLVRWRGYRAEDKARVNELYHDQELVLGKHIDKPDLQSKAIFLPMLLENSDGTVHGGFYVEAIAEVCFLGCDPQTTAHAKRLAPQAFAALQKFGFRIARIMLPRNLPEADLKIIRHSLAAVGFVSTDSEYEHYIRDLRGVEVEEGLRPLVAAEGSH